MGVACAVWMLGQSCSFSEVGYALIVRLQNHHVLVPGVVDVLRVILLLLHGVAASVCRLLLAILEIALRNLVL